MIRLAAILSLLAAPAMAQGVCDERAKIAGQHGEAIPAPQGAPL